MSTAATLAYASAVCAGAVMLIAVFRGWRSIAVWFFAAGMGLLVAESVLLGLASDALVERNARFWHMWRLVAMSFLPGVWLLFSLSYARGNYREFFRQWRWAVLGAFVLPVALIGVFPGRGAMISPVNMSDEAQWIFQLERGGMALYGLFLVWSIAVLMNLERTLQAAVGTMRWRIKFMILALGLLFAVRAYTASQALATRGIDPALGSVDCGALILGCLLMLRSLFRDVSAVAVFPSKAVLGNSLTVLVAGIYLLSLGLYAKLAVWIGSARSFQARAFLLLAGLVALTVIVLSDRVRLHTRRFISRYFQRPLHDYRTVWRTLTEGTTTRVNQGDLCQAAAALISQIFDVLSATIWLVDDKKENLVFAASTSLSAAAGASLQPQKEEAAAILRALHRHPDPVEVETSQETWAAVLRHCTPTQFRTGGGRVCVPLIAGGELLGLIALADRVSGVFFSLQDFELLRCVGDQVASGLRNAQLSQKLLQAKELEAFQTMSAFFIHDLKNTASTLNLMLQNLPVHFDNPAFREDALRGVAKTCDHINQLIGRLSQLRHDLQIKPVESDLNDVIAPALASWNGVAGVSLVKNLRPCPRLLLDPEQFLKVVTNLVINATEAVAEGGQVRIETSQSDGWAVLLVADNGCGMAPDFLSRALFRPFQTTKKNGFGIGMFQSKMIVEAHGGRIEVESELKKGTTFRVLLPIQKRGK
ncbi:MAG: XrtA/PEP-CTERM system histidine kinase PrsK [Verrucomicrobiota bacterium]|jgi:putative PEP-CTERM system histidine kinase